MFPVRSAAVDTLEEILGSGLRWEMVLYGEPMEDYMAETDDPVISAIWQGKDVVDFSSVVEGNILISNSYSKFLSKSIISREDIGCTEDLITRRMWRL